MRALARQSTRLASIRHSSRSRCNLAAEQIRNFTCTAHLSNESRGPNGNPDHNTRVENRKDKEEHKIREDEVAASTTEGELREAKSSHNAGRKLGTGKTRRQRLDEAIPRPPPIPSWFLNHNVKLQLESTVPNRSAKNAQVLRCVDRETGHTLFILPWYEAWPAPDADGTASATKKKHIDQGFFDNKFASPLPAATSPSKTSVVPIISPPPKDTVEDLTPHNLLRWALLEAETGIRAGFTAAARAQPVSSHAASQVDISLLSDPDTHDQLDELVEDLAALTQADLIRLDANDLSDLTAEYVGKGLDSPGSFSALGYDVFDGYTSGSNQPARAAEEDEDMEEGEEEEEDADGSGGFSGGFSAGPFNGLDGLRKALFDNRHGLDKALGKLNITSIALNPTRIVKLGSSGFGNRLQSMHSPDSDDTKSWNSDKLAALLDSLLDAPESKRSSTVSGRPESFPRSISKLMGHGKQQSADTALSEEERSYRALQRYWRSSPSFWLPDVAGLLAGHIARSKDLPIDLEGHDGTPSNASDVPRRTIVHVRDLKDICNSKIGDAIIRKLVRVVVKRRRAGEEILIVGTTAQDAVGGTWATFAQSVDDFPFRTINIPAFFNMSKTEQTQFKVDASKIEANGNPTHHKILEINSRHLESMLKRLRPGEPLDLFTEGSQRQLCLAGSHILSQKVLSLNHVQRLLLTAIGLSQTHAQSETINASHIGLAALITGQADRNARAWTTYSYGKEERQDFAESLDRLEAANVGVDKAKARIDQLAKTCNPHERRLLTGVVDAQNIKTGFGEVHAPPETIDSLKTMTSLSLLRPEAFKYGVLAADRLPGLMLYGPPGTGKTLLARAVAKESRATVLEVSGAQIYEK